MKFTFGNDVLVKRGFYAGNQGIVIRNTLYSNYMVRFRLHDGTHVDEVFHEEDLELLDIEN